MPSQRVACDRRSDITGVVCLVSELLAIGDADIAGVVCLVRELDRASLVIKFMIHDEIHESRLPLLYSIYQQASFCFV